MNKLTEYLAESITRFFKSKDLILKRIEKIEIKDDIIHINLKDGSEQVCLVQPFIELEKALERLKKYEQCTLVAYNTKGNYDIMLENWERLVNFKKKFNLYFVNPFSKLSKQWGVYPYTHNMVAGGEGIKLGLETLRSNVDFITKEELEKIIT